MRLGIVQTSPAFGNKEKNRGEIEQLTDGQEADLWIMPELALTGYEFRDPKELRELAEEIPHGDSTRWLADFCGDRNCWAVMGLPEREKGHVFNTAILCGPHRLLGRYRKLHLFDVENERFEPGNLPLPVFDLGFARVGLMICFDWRYPEAARTLTLRGAQIIAHPSNLVAPFCQSAMVTRALENRVFIATGNRVGHEHRAGRKLHFTGGSVVVNPDGETLMRLADKKAECRVIEIEPKDADNKMATPYNHLLKGMRTEFYLQKPE